MFEVCTLTHFSLHLSTVQQQLVTITSKEKKARDTPHHYHHLPVYNLGIIQLC